MIEPMPLRLHREAAVISRSGDPGAPDEQSACAETAARIVLLEEALIALLEGLDGASHRARQLLARG